MEGTICKGKKKETVLLKQMTKTWHQEIQGGNKNQLYLYIRNIMLDIKSV